MNWQALEATIEPRRMVLRFAYVVGLILLTAQLVVLLNLDLTSIQVLIPASLIPGLSLLATEIVLQVKIKSKHTEPEPVPALKPVDEIGLKIQEESRQLREQIAQTRSEIESKIAALQTTLSQALEGSLQNREQTMLAVSRDMSLLHNLIEQISNSNLQVESKLTTSTTDIHHRFETLESALLEISRAVVNLGTATEKSLEKGYMRKRLGPDSPARDVTSYPAYQALTPKEKAILTLLAKGYDVKRVAHSYNLEVGEVQRLRLRYSHLMKFIRKLVRTGASDEAVMIQTEDWLKSEK